MTESTNLNAEQLLELALRTSRACRERQRRTAARAEEERARLAALHGRIDELERALNEGTAKRAVLADAFRSYASDLAAIAKAVGLGDMCEPPDVLEAVRGAIAERDAMAKPCCECSDLRKSLDGAREEAEQWHRKAMQSDDERLRAALDKREQMQRERDAARAAVHEAEERGALAVFRAIERAVSMGHVVPVPSDERVWPSVAARICAEARAKGGE